MKKYDKYYVLEFPDSFLELLVVKSNLRDKSKLAAACQFHTNAICTQFNLI